VRRCWSWELWQRRYFRAGFRRRSRCRPAQTHAQLSSSRVTRFSTAAPLLAGSFRVSCESNRRRDEMEVRLRPLRSRIVNSGTPPTAPRNLSYPRPSADAQRSRSFCPQRQSFPQLGGSEIRSIAMERRLTSVYDFRIGIMSFATRSSLTTRTARNQLSDIKKINIPGVRASRSSGSLSRSPISGRSGHCSSRKDILGTMPPWPSASP